VQGFDDGDGKYSLHEGNGNASSGAIHLQLRRISIMRVLRVEPGLHRNTVTLLYNETATRVDLDAIDKLCQYFNCTVSMLLEYVPQQNPELSD
jgi:putative transcriptional regulator